MLYLYSFKVMHSKLNNNNNYLICLHSPSGNVRPQASYIHISQCTSACIKTITCTNHVGEIVLLVYLEGETLANLAGPKQALLTMH